ncbi:hypothetical protein ALC60_10760, partial [Trachymyrmex zeteki]
LAALATESILIGLTGIATLTRYSKSTLTLSCYRITILPIGHSEQMGSGLLPRRMQGPLSGQGHAYDIIHHYQFHYSCTQRNNYPRAVDNSFRDNAHNWHHRDLLDNPSNDLHDPIAYTIPCRNNICPSTRCSCKLQEVISNRINRLLIVEFLNA